MKALPLFFSLLCLSFFGNANAQDEKQQTVFLNFGLNTCYEHVIDHTYIGILTELDAYMYDQTRLETGLFSIGLEFQPGKTLSHELELMPLYISRDNNLEYQEYDSQPDEPMVTGGETTTFLKTYLRYQASYYFLPEKILSPSVGLSAQLFYDYLSTIPKTTEDFPYREYALGVRLALVPGIRVRLNDILAFDLDVPLALGQVNLDRRRYDNPLIPLSERNISKTEAEFLPVSYIFRAGISCKIR
ncbi:MAG: hypothetical protein JW801_03470 [Bacteroidales bacterium]|nr:hypothetical protein [Bacteroidales bacterium]